jgi:stage IV sporulation protein FB
MVQALSKTGPATPVLDAMTADIPSVSAAARLEEALKLMQGRSAPAVGIIDADGRLVGYVTPENIGELMMVESAGLGLRPRRPTGPLLPQ